MILWSVHVLFLEAVLEIGRIDLEPIPRVAPVCQYIGHHQRQKRDIFPVNVTFLPFLQFCCCFGNEKHENVVLGAFEAKEAEVDFPGVSRNLLRGEQLVSLVETPEHNQQS